MKTIAVDLDGVLAEYDGWKGIEHIGKPMPGAREFMKKLKGKVRVLVFTCRVMAKEVEGELFHEGYSTEDRVAIVKKWLDDNKIPFDEIYTGRGKPFAVAYVDDRAVVVNRRYDEESGAEFERAYDECMKLVKGKEKE